MQDLIFPVCTITLMVAAAVVGVDHIATLDLHALSQSGADAALQAGALDGTVAH